ncbi:acetyl-CoA C-acyltransferase [Halioxenophilus sp. WMMB6]|uniref:acetyl-CoA C-acyltransferase n=1 Tax=Halioxenophilus sp. WMMB6 TaxID=3073815 RepID=UPI00295F04A8|nr:acetyl-CoA C-acyltransferase [Halioxenophilus sp. WMMB6]
MEAYIVDAVRTAGGRRKGSFSGTHPSDLGGKVLDALIERTGVDPQLVEDVIVGCVTKAGEQAFAIGRSCVLASNALSDATPAVTIDRQCGSSQQAVQFAAQAVLSGTQDIIIAAGVENMTRVPMQSDFRLHEKAGIGMGPWSQAVLDKYGVKEFSQFDGADMIAKKNGFTREMLDQFAYESHMKAAAAVKADAFADEIIPVETEIGVLKQDEGIRFDCSAEGLAKLDTILPGGFHTAGNASQMTDAASAALIVGERALKKYGFKPLAKIKNFTVTAGDPVIMLEEPLRATKVALERAGMTIDQIDLFEVNEAFAAVPMAWLIATGADPAKLNVNGGAIALGHPLGASGTKLMSTLAYALRNRGLRYGLQVMCEGGGLANVTIIENLAL